MKKQQPKTYSPAQLYEGEKPVSLIECKTGFYVMPEFGVYAKDEFGKLVVITKREAEEARERYLKNFVGDVAAQEAKRLDDEIQDEISRLKSKVDERLNKLIPDMRLALIKAGKLKADSPIEEMILSLHEVKGSRPDGFDSTYETREIVEDKSPEWDERLKQYNHIVQLKESGDYDSLYMILFQDGLPQLASVSLGDEDGMRRLINNFHIDKLGDTLESIKTHSHLYNIAKINVS